MIRKIQAWFANLASKRNASRITRRQGVNSNADIKHSVTRLGR